MNEITFGTEINRPDYNDIVSWYPHILKDEHINLDWKQ